MRGVPSPPFSPSSWLPDSRAGRWALALFVVASVAVLFMGVVGLVQQPAATFDHDPLLAVPAALAAVCGVVSATLGAYSILRHERALAVILTTAAGLNLLAYVVGEAIRRG